MRLPNRLAMALLGPPPAASGPQASFLYRWFTDPVTRAIYPEADHARHSRVFVADLRAAVARRDHDAQATGMVTNLRRHSAEFTELWDMQELRCAAMTASASFIPRSVSSSSTA
jgi:hypothetical protein